MSQVPPEQPFHGKYVLPNRREDIEKAQAKLLSQVEQHRYDSASCFAIRLALEEALSNAFRHGNKQDPGKTVQMECQIDSRVVEIVIEDEGDGFEPQSVPDPTSVENVELPSGRGLTLMRAFMTEVNIPPPGNRVRMKYVRPV